MKQIEMTGKTISAAVESACAKLGVSILDVEYKVVEEPSKGFLGIGARPAKVIVTVIETEEAKEENKINSEIEKASVEEVEVIKAEEKEAVELEDEAEKSVEAEEEVVENESVRASLTEEDKNNIIKVACDFLSEVFEKMNMKVELKANFKDNKHIIINMSGEDMGNIIGKRGQTLDSIQYLTNLVVNKGEYPYMNITLDTEDYRAKRQKTLESLAFNLAKKAKHNRRNITLEPMNPYERRIIHATLQNDRYVTTYSEGVEPHRYVVIALKNNYSSKKNNN